MPLHHHSQSNWNFLLYLCTSSSQLIHKTEISSNYTDCSLHTTSKHTAYLHPAAEDCISFLNTAEQPKHSSSSAEGAYPAKFPPHWIVWGKQSVPLVRLSRFTALTPAPTNFSSHGSHQISEQQTLRAMTMRFAHQTKCTKFNPYAPHIKITGTIMRNKRKLRSFIYTLLLQLANFPISCSFIEVSQFSDAINKCAEKCWDTAREAVLGCYQQCLIWSLMQLQTNSVAPSISTPPHPH